MSNNRSKKRAVYQKTSSSIPQKKKIKKERKVKAFDLADDQQALDWLKQQDNQTASIKLLVKMASKMFGNEDLIKAITEEMLANPNLKTQFLSAQRKGS